MLPARAVARGCLDPRECGVLVTPCQLHPGLTMALTTLPMYTGSLRREQSRF